MKASLVKRLEAIQGESKLVYPYQCQFTDEADYIAFMDSHNPNLDWREHYRPLDSFYE
ncbi:MULTISPECIES: hypothetical protein [Shewanella]|uniref:hypothetical protein n=1 Tax=Shewanella TaxID=22 RepID=UPI000AC8560E|nr:MULTISPECIES: hypothetical protein [Shewanella]